MTTKILLDCDTGVDDTMAILYGTFVVLCLRTRFAASSRLDVNGFSPRIGMPQSIAVMAMG